MWNLGDGSLRLEVEVDGDQVAGYREFVKVPEGWTRDYKKLRSRNEAANVVDEVPWILLCIAGLALLIQRLRKRDVPVYLSLSFGLVTALLYFLGQLNMFSQAEFELSHHGFLFQLRQQLRGGKSPRGPGLRRVYLLADGQHGARLSRSLPALHFDPPLLQLAGTANALILPRERGGNRPDFFLLCLPNGFLSCRQ